MLAFALKEIPIYFRVFTFASGMISLIGFVLFYSGNYLGIGIGGMERVVSYTYTLWMILFGSYMLRRGLCYTKYSK